MNAGNDLERRLADYYATEVPPRAPDRVLGMSLATIDTTRQRRALLPAPWRFPNMNTYLKWAIAAVVVIAVGALGLSMLRPGAAPSVGAPGEPSPSPSPSPSLSPDPHAPPPLSESFTSTVNGLSISYPQGWIASPATEPWTATSDPNYGSAARDQMHDPVVEDHLFLSMASQPLGDTTSDTWMAAVLAEPEEGCGTPVEPITIDGAQGQMCDGLATVTAGGRGYFVRVYTSSDESWIDRNFDRAWFKTVLETMRLDPANATGASPKASASS